MTVTYLQDVQEVTRFSSKPNDIYTYWNSYATSGSSSSFADNLLPNYLNEESERHYINPMRYLQLLPTDDYQLFFQHSVFNHVIKNIELLTVAEVKSASEKMIKLLAKRIQSYNKEDLPSIYSVIRDDGSHIIEWIFEHYKLAFFIEVDQEDSSWHFISDEYFGYIQAFGDIRENNFSAILDWVLPFIIKNS